MVEKNQDRFCTRVRALRQAQNLSIEELAQRSGVPQGYLESLEQNIIPPRMTVYHAARLSRTLGCLLHELFE